MFEKLNNWLTSNLLDFEIQDQFENIVFNIKDIGSFLFLERSEETLLFDDNFELILDDSEIELTVDFYCFYFGDNFYYTKKDTNNPVKLQKLKNLGIAKKELTGDFCHLGIHAGYELLNGSGKYPDWVKKCKFLGYTSLGISEVNTLAATLPFQIACDEQNIAPILGETINIKLDNNLYRLCKVFSKNLVGWKNLLKINAEINVFNDQFCTIEKLLEFSEGLIFVFGNDFPLDSSYFKKIKSKFENCFYQISTSIYDLDKKDQEFLLNIKSYLDNYSSKLEPILINDSFYIDKDYFTIKKLLNKISTPKFSNSSKNEYFKSLDESYSILKELFKNDYLRFFDIWKKSVENTNLVSSLCKDFRIDLKSLKIPNYNLTKEQKEAGYENSEQLFLSLIEEKFKEKIESKIDNNKLQIYKDRLTEELRILKLGSFFDYFLILWDIIAFCKREDILVGIGRGSAAGSIVSYLFEITYLDPIEYDLLFERFLNEARLNSLPDIDSDFEGLRRDDVKRYMEERFGNNHVCSIGTYSTLKTKMALKDIGRAFDMNHDKINWITKALGEEDAEGKDINELFLLSNKNSELKEFVKNNVDLVNNIMICLGQPRSRSIHASGVIIVPDKDKEGNEINIYEWFPVVKINEQLVSEWEGTFIADKANFLKEDILGIALLDKWANIRKLVYKNTGDLIDIYSFPLDDKRVYEMFQKGYNEDVFQFQSDSQKSYCKLVLPDNIEDLISMNALYRPGPLDSGAHIKYAQLKHGEIESEIDFFMEDVTGNTGGLWVYQEQIMKAFSKITNSSLKDADAFRKFITKLKSGAQNEENYQKYMSMFMTSYLEKGASEEIAITVWEKMVAFAKYGFNRSHAVAYAVMGYYSQYLKVHYPLEFWVTALQFSSDDEIYKRISELNKVNSEVKLMPPDINKSTHVFYPDYETNNIYWSLSKVKYVGDKQVDYIIKDRTENGLYYSLDEFLKRVPKKNINKRSIYNLIISGAFDDIENVVTAKDRIELIKKYSLLSKNEINKDYTVQEIKHDWWWTLKQKESCGLGYIDYSKIIKQKSYKHLLEGNTYIDELNFQQEESNNKSSVIGGIVLYINNKQRKDGERFCDLKLDINNEIVFATVWPETFNKYNEQIKKSEGKMILLTGSVSFNTWRGCNTFKTNDESELQILNQ